MAEPKTKRLPEADLAIHHHFDSGNIEFKGCERKGDGLNLEHIVHLNIRPEPFTQHTDKTAHFQWFHFRAVNTRRKRVCFRIENAGDSSFAVGWKNYRTCMSHDFETWCRVSNTTYKDGVLTWTVDFRDHDTAWFAYFPPYTYTQHQQLVARCSLSPFTSTHSMGSSLQGRPLDLIIVNDKGEYDAERDAKKPKFWVIARQHPGETMAEWCVDGMLERLLCSNDAIAKFLRAKCSIFVVPNMNPDGSFLGHLRTNACGANLNREWASTGDYVAPSLERSPEVFHFLRYLDSVGCDGLLDVHGDEEIEANFLCLSSGAANWNEGKQGLWDAFAKSLKRANPDFQTKKGYGRKEPGTANPAVCSAQITERCNCFASTFEMPFKDTIDEFPQEHIGWDADRSKRLGASFLDGWATLTKEEEASSLHV